MSEHDIGAIWKRAHELSGRMANDARELWLITKDVPVFAEVAKLNGQVEDPLSEMTLALAEIGEKTVAVAN